MLLSNFYNDLDVLINQDGTDDYFGIDDFNRILPDEQVNFIFDIVKEEDDNPGGKVVLKDYLLTYQSGTYNRALPTDYLWAESATDSTNGKKADILTYAEYLKRTANILSPPIAENPIVILYGSYLRGFPASGNYELYYVKKPTDPFLDYYINSNNELVFIAASVDLTTLTGTYRDGTALPHAGTSVTVELGIPVIYHERFMERMIDRLSLKDRDQFGAGYAIQKNQEDSAKN
jgi:hypothetical protein